MAKKKTPTTTPPIYSTPLPSSSVPVPAASAAGSSTRPVPAASPAGTIPGSSSAPVPAASAAGTTPASPSPPSQRRSNGTFAPGHTKTGGIQQGQKQRLSLRVQNAVLSMVATEVEQERFAEGLTDLYTQDPKGYYQVLAALMKFCAPTLQSQSLEIQDSQTIRTIDDRLDQLMQEIHKH